MSWICEIERFDGWIILNIISSLHLPHMKIEYQISEYLGGCLIMNIEHQISKYLGGCHHRGVWLGPSRDTGDRRREAVGHKLLSRSSSGLSWWPKSWLSWWLSWGLSFWLLGYKLLSRSSSGLSRWSRSWLSWWLPWGCLWWRLCRCSYWWIRVNEVYNRDLWWWWGLYQLRGIGKIEFAGNDFQSFCLSRTEIFACSASL